MCFGDVGLRDEIIPRLSEQSGLCPTCKAADQPLVEAGELNNYFELLVGIYSPADQGRPLVECLIDDWALFETSSLSPPEAQVLLAEILDDGEIVRRTFGAGNVDDQAQVEKWDQLREELKERNRYFPQSDLDLDWLENLLSALTVSRGSLSEKWFRARVQKEGKPYSATEMGAPPAFVASHGRANPAGIPYLYLASREETAIAEVRPHPGERISIAEFGISTSIVVVDLRAPRKTITPFLSEDEDAIRKLRDGIDFLECLGEELKTPVRPTAAAIDYVPSQYLCEFIKKVGYDGVLYASSVDEGVNLALFDPKLGDATATRQVEVTVVSVDFREREEA
jgi:hypothetical protein